VRSLEESGLQVEKISVHNQVRSNLAAGEVTAGDPASLFVVKSLLYPVVAALTSIGCLMSTHQPLNGANFLLEVLTFAGTAELLGVPRLQAENSWPLAAQSFADLVLRWALVVGLILTLLYISDLSQRFSPGVLRRWAIATPLVLWLAQLAARRILRHRVRNAPVRKAVIVGMTGPGVSLARMLGGDTLIRTEVLGFFEDRQPGDPARVDTELCYKILGRSTDLPRFVPEAQVSVVYIALPMRREPRVLRILEALRDSTVSVYFVPDMREFHLIQPRFDLVGGIPLLAVRESPFYGIRGICKRLFDVLIGGLAAVMLVPLLAVIAASVRLSSPGPVIFRQKRYGLDGREITVYKFRTMVVMEDGDTQFTIVTRKDPRVTALGAFLRRTSLDELPQLLNVLQGTMSLVGPRPHVVAMNERYRRLIPSYMLRHKIKPGITGWAQIHGHRGGDDLESMRKRIEFDLQYLSNWSLQLDLLIIARTVATVLASRHAY
jgi:putative colanic acid biosynthesis UDP-glucose lipid carrier transferase